MDAAEARTLFYQQAEVINGRGQSSPGEAAIMQDALQRIAPLPKPQPRERLKAHIDLSPDVPDEHTLVLRDAQGTPVELSVRIPTGSARKREWYHLRMAEIMEEMFVATDEADALRLDAQYAQYQTASTRLLIANLPDGLLEVQPPDVMLRFVQTMDQLVSEAMGNQADPLGYVRQVYAHVGEPDGPGDAGVVAWLEPLLEKYVTSPKDGAPTPTPI